MSAVWEYLEDYDCSKVLGILIADIHLSLNPPIWRSNEPDWFAAMRRPLDEVIALQLEFNCPIFCAGDIFDKWNSSPELLNFAEDALPLMYAIPGQHDLPLHNYSDIKKSAYYSLVKMCKIQNILPSCNVRAGDILVRGFPYGTELREIEPHKHENHKSSLALAHHYIWIDGKSYPNAAPGDNANLLRRTTRFKKGKMLGYDTLAFGDNHKGFSITAEICGSTNIFNCGTLMRRKSDEIDYKPQIGLILEDGAILCHELDISQDKHIEIPGKEELGEFDMKKFIKELEGLGETELEFADSMIQFMRTNKTNKKVKEIILKAMGM